MVPQFMLLAPEIDDPAVFLARFEALASAGALAVAWLNVTAESDAALKRKLEILAKPLQGADIACLVTAPRDPRLIARIGLDGAHAQASDDLAGLVAALKPGRILGVGGLRSRHEAMESGERDIDYVMFGEPRADGFVPPLAQTIERAEWWATIFNVPCVAYAPALDAVAPLTATGTEFIAVGPWLFETEDPAALLAEARRIAKSNVLERAERSSAPDLASRG
ncbi:MAG: thiamine phosphate synthase [Methylobacterium sp.]|nr:thiamine phosphate synthase [Methylobacterium sp.]